MEKTNLKSEFDKWAKNIKQEALLSMSRSDLIALEQSLGEFMGVVTNIRKFKKSLDEFYGME